MSKRPFTQTQLKRVVLYTPNDAADFLLSLRKTLTKLGYDADACSTILLACDEAIVNARRHGNSSDPRKGVDVRYRCDAKEFFIRIEDEGAGFDPKRVPDPTLPENLEVSHGRGLLLMRSYMEDVRFEEGGKVVVMSRSREWPKKRT